MGQMRASGFAAADACFAVGKDTSKNVVHVCCESPEEELGAKGSYISLGPTVDEFTSIEKTSFVLYFGKKAVPGQLRHNQANRPGGHTGRRAYFTIWTRFKASLREQGEDHLEPGGPKRTCGDIFGCLEGALLPFYEDVQERRFLQERISGGVEELNALGSQCFCHGRSDVGCDQKRSSRQAPEFLEDRAQGSWAQVSFDLDSISELIRLGSKQERGIETAVVDSRVFDHVKADADLCSLCQGCVQNLSFQLLVLVHDVVLSTCRGRLSRVDTPVRDRTESVLNRESWRFPCGQA